MKKARKAAVQKYIKSKQEAITLKLNELKEKNKDLTPEDIEKLFSEVSIKLKEIKGRISFITSQQDEIHPLLLSTKQRQSEVLVSLSRF